MNRLLACCVGILVAGGGCGDNQPGRLTTPEQLAVDGKDGQRVEVIGEVHAVTFDSAQVAARKALLAAHRDAVEWVLEQDDEAQHAGHTAFTEPDAKYPRTEDRYVLIRTTKPAGITFGEPDFSIGRLGPAWGLGVRITNLDAAHPMPDVGAIIKVTGTLRRITWNQRDVQVPVVEDATIQVLVAPRRLAGPGDACGLDQECNDRLICDRATTRCVAPPREIYWADPWRDVNGACTTDLDCPLGQVCDPAYQIAATGDYAAHYFAAEDVGRHVCTIPADATLASQCPQVYTTRDIVSGRFVTGKEICVRIQPQFATRAEDNDTHAQMRLDEPIPYPQPDLTYNLFGVTTENGPMYRDPALPGGAVQDPVEGQTYIAVGTYRYDPSHGWYEVHPVKKYFAVAPR
jgi:hypothetical protein